MKQLLLDLELQPAPSLDNFYAGPNRAVVQYLRQISSSPPVDFVPIYIWGASGSGKTHLLRGSSNQYAAERCGWLDQHSPASLDYCADWQLIYIDDVDKLSPAQQQLAFSWFAQAPADNIQLISSGSLPPAELAIREDLRTRVGWGQIFYLQPFDDAQLTQLLQQQAELRGIRLSANVISFMLLHLPRDIYSMLQLLRRLDQFSLEHKRHITIPLLKTVLSNPIDKI